MEPSASSQMLHGGGLLPTDGTSPGRGKSSVGKDVRTVSPKPLQGRNRAGRGGWRDRVSPRIARICTEYSCGVLQRRWAICEGGGHKVFDRVNERI